jgi:hypothetical protein
VTTNRIDEILNQIRADIESRRNSGSFPSGYELSVEEEHRLQLGKRPIDEIHQTQLLLNHLEQLKIAMGKLTEMPDDSSRFRLVRILRDTARVRHDLRTTKRHLIEINMCLQQVLSDVLSKTIREVAPIEAVANSMLTQVVERTLINEQLTNLMTDLEKRVQKLERESE